jgi:hypothetical protein
MDDAGVEVDKGGKGGKDDEVWGLPHPPVSTAYPHAMDGMDQVFKVR